MSILDRFPQQIAVNSRLGAQTYTVVPDQYAIHGHPGMTSRNAIQLLNEGAIAVFKGSPQATVTAGTRVSPVYELRPGGSPAVPTGLVFIRLADGVAISERQAEIENARYEVAETLAYAPNAAWVRARSGDIADALVQLGKLEKIPSVESVEPQMLMEAARR